MHIFHYSYHIKFVFESKILKLTLSFLLDKNNCFLLQYSVSDSILSLEHREAKIKWDAALHLGAQCNCGYKGGSIITLL